MVVWNTSLGDIHTRYRCILHIYIQTSYIHVHICIYIVSYKTKPRSNTPHLSTTYRHRMNGIPETPALKTVHTFGYIIVHRYIVYTLYIYMYSVCIFGTRSQSVCEMVWTQCSGVPYTRPSCHSLHCTLYVLSDGLILA